MSNDTAIKTASEIIGEFFDSLPNVEGMDQNTASIIQRLWREGRLSRDELMRVLSEVRQQEG